MHPLKKLRELIINPRPITSGTVIKIDGEDSKVATRFGILTMSLEDEFVKVGDTVTVQDNVVKSQLKDPTKTIHT